MQPVRTTTLTSDFLHSWRKRSLSIKIVWLVLIMALGNIAMSFYVLLQLFGLRAGEPASALFRQKTLRQKIA